MEILNVIVKVNKLYNHIYTINEFLIFNIILTYKNLFLPRCNTRASLLVTSNMIV
jgi:hypothetical protein